jgi:hypothetical protein
MGFQVKVYTESISTDYLLQRKKKKIILPLKEDYFHFDGGLNFIRCIYMKGWRGKTVREHTFYNHFTSFGNSHYPPKV